MRLTDNIYQQLKQDVFQAKYKPNEFISERQIAEKYGISKITASEALHRLCTEGHLTSYPRSGYMITSLSPREIEQLKRLRVAVESLAVEIICEEATPDEIRPLYDDIVESFKEEDNASVISFKFHMDMAKLTKDRFIVSILESLLGAASRVEQHIPFSKTKNWQIYHKEIVDALMKRNVVSAKEYLIKDINQR